MKAIRSGLMLVTLALAITTPLHADTLPAPPDGRIDLLELPALVARKAAQSMLLGAGLAGDRLVAAGDRGVIVFSDDQGGSWSQAPSPVSVTLTGVYFASPSTGWITGHDGVVLKSEDHGASWRKVLDGNRINALVEADLSQAVMVLEDVTDAGDANATERLEALRMRLEDVQAGSGFGPSLPLLGLWFDSERNGFAVGAFGQMLRTRDGGETWESLSSRMPNPDGLHLNAITRLPGVGLVVVGERGTLWMSANDGDTWTVMDTGYSGYLYGVAATTSGALVAYGFAGNLFHSSDRGVSWVALARSTDKALVAHATLADGRLLLVTRDGQVLLGNVDGSTFRIVADGRRRGMATVLPMPLASGALLAVGTGGASLIELNLSNPITP